MIKQPKYFLSSSKVSRPQAPAMTAPEAALPPTPTIHSEEAAVAPPRSIRRIPSAILGLGLSTLAALTILVGINSGVIQVSAFRGNLPVIFNHTVPTDTVVAAPHPGIGQGINFDIQTADARVEIVRSFLERYDSPLTPYEHYAQALVEASDRYGLDYRLLPAIMMQESNLCKTSDPKIHNCLGFGIHARGTLGFDTYEEGFDRAAKELKANYIDKGLTTPELIMRKYTPSSNGSWEKSVNQWIFEMEHNDREEGKIATGDADLLEYTIHK